MVQLERDYRFIVIDSEAGMEHISRGTIGKPDMLLIVSDPGARGLRTIARIKEIATQLGLEPGHIQIVFNRFKSGTAPVDIGNEIPIAIIPDDAQVEGADLAATPVSGIPVDSPARVAVMNLAKNIQKRAHECNGKPE
jgi:CO dehydrogenase maturation factor